MKITTKYSYIYGKRKMCSMLSIANHKIAYLASIRRKLSCRTLCADSSEKTKRSTAEIICKLHSEIALICALKLQLQKDTFNLKNSLTALKFVKIYSNRLSGP